MEYIIYLLEFVVFCLLLATVGLIIYFLWVVYRKYRRDKMYDRNNYNIRYAHIKLYLREEQKPLKESCDYLVEKLIQLAQMRYKDKEKTKELYMEFFRKYRDQLK